MRKYGLLLTSSLLAFTIHAAPSVSKEAQDDSTSDAASVSIENIADTNTVTLSDDQTIFGDKTFEGVDENLSILKIGSYAKLIVDSDGELTISGPTTVSGKSTFSGATTISGALSATGSATFSNPITMNVSTSAISNNKYVTTKEYVDNSAGSTLSSAKTYSDTGSASALSSAKTYTDTKTADTLTSAKAYADANDSDTKYSAGDGLTLSSLKFDIDSTVVRTSGKQTINGTKVFGSETFAPGFTATDSYIDIGNGHDTPQTSYVTFFTAGDDTHTGQIYVSPQESPEKDYSGDMHLRGGHVIVDARLSIRSTNLETNESYSVDPIQDGVFYSEVVNPTGSARLNYNGNLYASGFFGNLRSDYFVDIGPQNSKHSVEAVVMQP